MSTQALVGNILRWEASNAGNIDSHDSLKETPVQKLEASAKMDTTASKQEEKLREALIKENLILRNENMCLAIHQIFRDREQAQLQYCGYTPPIGIHPVPMSPLCALGLCMQKESLSSLTGDMRMYGLVPTEFQQYTDPTRCSTSIPADPLIASSNVTEVAFPPEQCTTVMMRNIPNNYTREMLFNLLDENGFKQKYDLFYMPVDFKKHVGLGYAFIHFVDSDAAGLFFTVFTGFNAWAAQSDKKCVVAWSDALQGRDANINRGHSRSNMHRNQRSMSKRSNFQNTSSAWSISVS